MGPLHITVWTIKEKFPKQSALIDRLFEEDTDFRSLCKDYYLCLRSLETYENDDDPDENTIREYKDICNDLEKELRSFLSRE